MARMKTLSNKAKLLSGDQVGSLLPMAAAGLFVVAAVVGGGLDISTAYKAQNRLQAACDAGVLAGRRAVGDDGFDSDAQAEARAFFNTNYDPNKQRSSNVVFTPTSPDNGNTVEATASSDVETAIMSIFGYDEIDISVDCSASMGVGNSDVVMVLDSTGSMGWRLTTGGPTKLSMLQDAMKNFYDTLESSTAGGSARIRYGFVPYSQSINVGHLLEEDWIVDDMDIQSREAQYETVTEETDEISHYEDPVYSSSSGESSTWLIARDLLNADEYRRRRDCRNDLPSNTSWSDYGSASSETETEINSQGQEVTTTTTTQLQTRETYTCIRVRDGGRRYWAPQYSRYARNKYDYDVATRDPVYVTVETTEFSHFLYKAVNYDVSSFKLFNAVNTPTGSDGEDVTSTWRGCIEERDTVASGSIGYNSVSGITPSEAYDLDIDSVPTSDDATKWRPMWGNVSYYRTEFVSTWRGGYWDLSSRDESENGGQASSRCPYEAQLLTEMSEAAFDNYADSLIATGNTYHDLGILWGARLSSPQGLFASNVNAAPANGGNVSRHLIFMTDGSMQPSVAVQSAYGIEFHDKRVTDDGSDDHTSRHNDRFLALCEAVKAKGIRLWVIAFATGLTDELVTCASDQSSFLAENASELNTAFQEIAKEVGELRITQ